MSEVSSRRQVRCATRAWRARAVAGVVVASLVLVGCSAEGDDSNAQPHQVATGVLLDKPDGTPVSGIELELLVWPSPQGGAGPTKAADLVAVDTDTTAADGSFDLDALAADLSRHASASGQVGLEIRRAGSTGSGLRTTVRLTKAQDTGTTTVQPATGLLVTMAGIDQCDEAVVGDNAACAGSGQ